MVLPEGRACAEQNSQLNGDAQVWYIAPQSIDVKIKHRNIIKQKINLTEGK